MAYTIITPSASPTALVIICRNNHKLNDVNINNGRQHKQQQKHLPGDDSVQYCQNKTKKF